jgi:hypothetical protein
LGKTKSGEQLLPEGCYQGMEMSLIVFPILTRYI